MNANSLVNATYDRRTVSLAADVSTYGGDNSVEALALTHNPGSKSKGLPFLVVGPLSSWSRSRAKRIFDCACVLPVLPLLLPLMLAISLLVRFTSSGPALFRQKRIGLHGKTFTILKFRTMLLATDKAHHAVTTAGNQRFTPIGPFLRRWKLDELPQLLNVLKGEMSLVGPRPKLPQHVISDLPCRPGITGAATFAFAREEAMLDRIPRHSLEAYYYSVVLPAKRMLDAEYMARATFFSDLKLIVNSVLRRWDTSTAEELLSRAFKPADHWIVPRTPGAEVVFNQALRMPPASERPVVADHGVSGIY